MNAEFECSHCHAPLGKYYLFELKRYRDDTPRPVCRACVKVLVEFGELIEGIIKGEDENELHPKQSS